MSYIGIPPFGQTIRSVTNITATASQTTFNIVGGYQQGYVDVYLNGVLLVPTTDYTATDGLTVVLGTGASSGDAFQALSYQPVSLIDCYTQSQVDTLLAAKQDTLVSGTNIKTINSTSLLGSGDIAITSSPAGSNTYVQYNNAGSFGGSANFVFDGTNVGIGTASPQSLLSVKVSSSRQLDVVQDGGDDHLVLKSTSPEASYNLRSIELAGADVSFSTGASSGTTYTESMRIDSSGNVGIGTSSPGAKLQVTNGGANSPGSNLSGNLGQFTSSGGIAYVTMGNGDSANQHRYVGAASAIQVFGKVTDAGVATEQARISSAGGLSVGTTADPGAGAIYATGNITAYYSSDAKFKENIKDVDGALDKVCAIGSKTFDWTDEYIESKGGEDGYFVQKSDFGVVAQDVQAVFPQAVRTREDGTLAVDYEKLATLAFGAIKELVKRVEALEAK